MLQLDAHIRRCPDARSAGGQATGSSSALAASLARDPRESGDMAFGGRGSGRPVPEEIAPEEDLRIECQVCGRKFATDRVDKHQAICTKLKNKGARREFQVQRRYCEGGSEGRTVALGASPSAARKRREPTDKLNSSPINSNWRKQSAEFREAMRAGREHPMPRWGEDAASPGGRGSRSPWRPRLVSASRSGPQTSEGWRPRGGGWSPQPKTSSCRFGSLSPDGRRSQPSSPMRQTGMPSSPVRQAGMRAAAMTDGFRSREVALSIDAQGLEVDFRPSQPSSPSRTASQNMRGAAMTDGFRSRQAGLIKEAQGSQGDVSSQLKAQFAKLDSNGDGCLDFRELSGLLRSGNPRMSDRAMHILFNSIDKNGKGRIDFGEFVDYVHEVQSGQTAFDPGCGVVTSYQQPRTSPSSTLSRMSTAPAAARAQLSASPGQRPGKPQSAARRRDPTSPGAGFPEQGSVAASRYGRDCMTSPPPRRSQGGPLQGGSLPEWGSGASSRYGRDCMTSPPLSLGFSS